jgi:hypothetical protein
VPATGRLRRQSTQSRLIKSRSHGLTQRRAARCNQIARMAPQRRRWGPCGCTHATQRPSIRRLSMQHACTSAEGPRTTRAAPCNQIARMAPQRRRWGLCGCTHAMEGPITCRLSMQHACTSAEGPRTTRALPCNQIARMAPQRRRWGLCAWVYARYPPRPPPCRRQSSGVALSSFWRAACMRRSAYAWRGGGGAPSVTEMPNVHDLSLRICPPGWQARHPEPYMACSREERTYVRMYSSHQVPRRRSVAPSWCV